jgi:hypothetical protein
MLKFNKAEFGVDRLKIFHKTKGSTRMLTRDLSEKGENAGLKLLKPVTEGTTYPTDYFKWICASVLGLAASTWRLMRLPPILSKCTDFVAENVPPLILEKIKFCSDGGSRVFVFLFWNGVQFLALVDGV